ncbi:MAG: hypothetical protein ACPLYD_15550, partial [Anaerolineae bacterium]
SPPPRIIPQITTFRSDYPFTVGGLKFFWTGSLDVVLAPARGELGLFWSPRVFGSPTETWLMGASDDIFPFISPQIGGSITWGKVWGDIFQERGVEAYKGPFTYGGITISPQSGIGVTGEVFASHSDTGALTAEVMGIGKGIALGLSFPPQGEAHVYVTESKPLGDISRQEYLEYWEDFWQEVFREALKFPTVPGP